MREAKRTRGRPVNLSLEYKREIVETFFEFKANRDPAKLRVHNIFKLLADYANEAGYKTASGGGIKPKDFSADEVRAFIHVLASQAEQESSAGFAPPAYTPLDIDAIRRGSRDDILQSVLQRDSYYKSVCVSAGRVFDRACALQLELNDMRNRLSAAEQRCKDLEQELSLRQKDVSAAEKEVRHLHNLLRKETKIEVLSYLKAAPDKGPKEDDIRKIIEQPILTVRTEQTKAGTDEGKPLHIDFNTFFHEE